MGSSIGITTEEKVQAIAKWLNTGSLNLFGRPFAGKDTQCNHLSERFGAPVISGGHILRSTTIPEHVKKIMEAGELVPIDDYLKIITPYLSQSEFEGRPLVLSSLGRWHGEEAGIIKGTSDAGHPLKAVIFLNISEDTVLERWNKLHEDDKRGIRADDAHASLEVRLKEFANKTVQVIDFYREKGLLIDINGSLPPGQVEAEILDKLYDLAIESAEVPV